MRFAGRRARLAAPLIRFQQFIESFRLEDRIQATAAGGLSFGKFAHKRGVLAFCRLRSN
jgi:hypothetical protein